MTRLPSGSLPWQVAPQRSCRGWGSRRFPIQRSFLPPLTAHCHCASYPTCQASTHSRRLNRGISLPYRALTITAPHSHFRSLGQWHIRLHDPPSLPQPPFPPPSPRHPRQRRLQRLQAPDRIATPSSCPQARCAVAGPPSRATSPG